MGSFRIFWCLRRRTRGRIREVDTNANQKDEPLGEKELQFTYSEIQTITSNFERVVGRGDLGFVYHGYLDQHTEVAVKMVSSCSIHQQKHFQKEALLHARIRHRNLSSLVGYCSEGTKFGFIYDYVSNGTLRDHLSDANTNPIKWEKRLRIAIGAAQGLEYLHNDPQTQMIHGNVKSTNILLDQEFQAKLSDFGLSKVFPNKGGSHESTRVVGTHGYLDPMYYISNRLSKKSDVFSFGVVLLEIITGRPSMGRDHEKKHIRWWVMPLVAKGEISSIVCPSLRGEYNTNSVWKAVELAMACTSIQPDERPTTDNIMRELKECLVLEQTQPGEGHDSESTDLSEVNSTHLNPQLNIGVAAGI